MKSCYQEYASKAKEAQKAVASAADKGAKKKAAGDLKALRAEIVGKIKELCADDDQKKKVDDLCSAAAPAKKKKDAGANSN